MNRKLGINIDCLIGVDELDALDLAKAAGFETFFTNSYTNDIVAPPQEKGRCAWIDLRIYPRSLPQH